VNEVSNVADVSEKFFEDEKRIWKTGWLLVGRAADVKEKGEFFTFDLDVINTSVVILRQDNGHLAAYHNVCSHRSGRLVCDRHGQKTVMTCRFHGWTFQLDGKLRDIPEKQLFPSLDRKDYSLESVCVDTWGGFVFINLDPSPEYSLKEYLKGLPTGLDAYVSDPSWQWYSGYKPALKANWKDLMNIQHDGMHASHVHKTTLGMYFSPENASNTVFEESPGVCSRLTVKRGLESEELLARMTNVQKLAMKYGTTSNWVDQDTSKAANQIKDAVNLTASNRWVFDCYTFFPNLLLFVGTDVLMLMRFWPVDTHNAIWELDLFYKDELQNFGNLFNREQGALSESKCVYRRLAGCRVGAPEYALGYF